jgi:hypothetical protein
MKIEIRRLTRELRQLQKFADDLRQAVAENDKQVVFGHGTPRATLAEVERQIIRIQREIARLESK